MKYRKTNKPNTNTGVKPYCKRILFSKLNVEYSEPEIKQHNKKEGQVFIPPLNKNKYIFPTNVSQKECKEDDTDTNTSVNESAVQNDLTPRKETVIIQTQRKDNVLKNETVSRNVLNGNAIKVNKIIHNDESSNSPIDNIKSLNATTSTLRDLIKTHKKSNSTLFFNDIECSKSFMNKTNGKDKCIHSIENIITTNNDNSNSNNQHKVTINFTTVANTARQYYPSNAKKCSSLLRDKTVNHLLNNSLLYHSQNNSKFQSKNTSANSSIIVDNNSYTQSIPYTARQTIKHTLSTSMPSSSLKNNNPHTKSVSFLVKQNMNMNINFQELLEMQIKLNHILLKINSKASPHLELFSWWNYFYKSTFIKSFLYYFEINSNKHIIDSSLKLESLTSILCLEISKTNIKCKKALDLFKAIFSLIHFNFLIYIKYLLIKLKPSNIFADKLNNIIKNELSDSIYNKEFNETFITDLIKNNTKNIAQYYKELIQRFYINNNTNKQTISNVVNYKLNSTRYSPRNKFNGTRNIRLNKQENDNENICYSFFTNAFNNLNAYTYDEYNDFIVEYINNEQFDYDINNDNCYYQTARDHYNSNHNSSRKIFDGSILNDCHKSNDIDSNSIDIILPDDLNISINSTPRENVTKPQHKKTNSCSSSISSSLPFSELLNQLKLNNNNHIKPKHSNKSQNDMNTKTIENNIITSIIHSPRSRSPNIPRQTSILLRSKYLLPEISKQHEYTLILDLDETLVHVVIDNTHNTNKAKVIYRPNLFEFLSRMKRLYEIVIFTVSTKDYADKVCDCIEKKEKYFDYKLYRQHVTYIDGKYYKDLSKLGRDLNKVVIVDNMSQNFELQQENGIEIKPFYGNCSLDKSILYELGSILEQIRFDSYKDVRKSILKYKDIIKSKIN